ncbi:ABC transporter substrate-binding protein [Streptomyces sp. SID161]|uniref:ABC transporter substrate-binding protein n=1 Tax=unclassified Streptomyces TaxID=2593676 RepID=UPI001367F034|nr:ABC transporter substrate-binding protein [Streptomyces sp. SID161]MYW16498.1 ABC transporter substrate-binding protein [Streptomyces sp. SID2955]MYW46139.1 ABC transporter substrate-binding protein [Streptomyces sp. SID161]
MPASTSTLRRRSLLRGTGALVLAAAVGSGMLTACSSDDPDARTTAAKPRTVDTLKIAVGDPTKATGTDPRAVGNGLSSMVMFHLYDSLMSLEGDKYTYKLARSVTPNADGTKWTITLRDGATFHDGRPVTAADVAYSLRTVGAPPSNRVSVFTDVDLAHIKVVDAHTLQVPLKQPRGDFREAVLSTYSPVFPAGTKDFGKDAGSGPYKLDGVDGGNVRLVANDKYWGGKPSVKHLELIRIDDPAARLNAVKSGQADYAVGISAVGAAAVKADKAVTVERAGLASANALSFSMNQTIAPFDNPQVRKALRLAIDRKQLVDTALLGNGRVGDDVVGEGLPGYATDLPARQRDVAEARKLLRAAGVTKLTLRTSEIVPGMTDASRLFAQQLAAAGVKLTLQNVPADAYYADLMSLTKQPFQAFYYANRPAPLHLAATTSKGAFFNVTGAGPDHFKQLAAAQRIVDDARRAEAFKRIEHDFYDNGGDIVWAFQDQLDATRVPLKSVVRIGAMPVFAAATAG